MKSFVKILNVILIITLCLFILFSTSIFFLGSKESHLKLVDNLPESFFVRFFGGVIIGVMGTGLILLINLLLKAIHPAISLNLRKLLWTLIITFCLSSLLGTTFFFFH